MIDTWRKYSNRSIAKNLLDSVAELTNGTLHTVTCVNSRGESSTKYVIEVPDARSSDVSGSDTSDS